MTLKEFVESPRKIAINCKTEKEADRLYIELRKYNSICIPLNIQTAFGMSGWREFGIETCYVNNCILPYVSKKFAISRNYVIINFNDINDFKNSFMKSDLKAGDVCVRGDGNAEIAIPELGVLVCKSGGFNTFSGMLENMKMSTLTSVFDIVKVYRPQASWQCVFNPENYTFGELVFDRGKTDREVEKNIRMAAYEKEMNIIHDMIDKCIKYPRYQAGIFCGFNAMKRMLLDNIEHSDKSNNITQITIPIDGIPIVEFDNSSIIRFDTKDTRDCHYNYILCDLRLKEYLDKIASYLKPYNKEQVEKLEIFTME